MRFKQSYVQRVIQNIQECKKQHKHLWGDACALTKVVALEIPRFDDFYTQLCDHGNIDAALSTGVLPELKAKGYLSTHTEHITNAKLLNGCHIWQLKWANRMPVHVERSGSSRGVSTFHNHIDLKVSIDPEKREINTEFFSWNPSVSNIGDIKKTLFDDVEKFHIVWHLPSGSTNLRLQYLGLGTNEPWDQEHPERAIFRGYRPRFYIFDRTRYLSFDTK